MTVLTVSLIGYLFTIHGFPPGLLNDEVDIGYEANSILLTARDQWGNFLPLQYFSGFGGTRLPLLIYWTVAFIKFFGLNQEGLRLAGVAAALLGIVGFFFLLKNLYDNLLAGLATIVLILTPWFWGLTRTTNEAVLALSLTIWGILFLYLSRKKDIFLILAAIFLGLSFYAYYSSQIFTPLLMVLLFWKWPWLHKGKLFPKAASLMVFLFIISPLILKTLTGGGSAVRLEQTGIFGNVSLVGELNVRRFDCEQNAPAIWCRTIYNKPLLWLGEVSANYLNHFSPTFLFTDNWFVGILPPGRLFFLGLLPGLIAGFLVLVRESQEKKWLWLGWLLAAPIADSLTSNGQAMRALLIVPPLVAIAVIGWRSILNYLDNPKLKILLISGLAIFLLFETAHFLSDYFWYFPLKNSMYSHYPYQPLMDYLLSVEKDYPQIYISNAANSSIKQYAFYVFYDKFDPHIFQNRSTVKWERENEGWIWVKQIGKWNFVKSLPPLYKIPRGSLLVSDPDETSNTSKLRLENIVENQILTLTPLKTIRYLNGDPAFVISVVNPKPLGEICNETTSQEIINAVCNK